MWNEIRAGRQQVLGSAVGLSVIMSRGGQVETCRRAKRRHRFSISLLKLTHTHDGQFKHTRRPNRILMLFKKTSDDLVQTHVTHHAALVNAVRGPSLVTFRHQNFLVWVKKGLFMVTEDHVSTLWFKLVSWSPTWVVCLCALLWLVCWRLTSAC